VSEAGKPSGSQLSPARNWRRARIAVQIIAFTVFLYLLIGLSNSVNLLLPHHLFFILDPLAGIMTMIAGREFIPVMTFGAITLALAVFSGRAWCGWICPMGTILDWTKGGRGRRLPGRESASSLSFSVPLSVL